MKEEMKNSLLIVDDERVNLDTLTYILESDYTIFTAINGKEAIDMAKEYSPDLILLDIMMPEMDGYETLSRLKEYDETKRIPVIIISGLSSNESEEKGLSLEASDYITKPFSAMNVKLRVKNQIQIINQLYTSMKDQLSNLPNRRYFDERFHMEWKAAIRSQTPLSILIIDLDKFKAVNDTYGHQHGDIVIQEVGKILSGALRRSTDFASRWGGEEFAVLFPNTNMEGAMEVAEHIRAETEERNIRLDNDTVINITVSIGVNTIAPTQNSSIEDFISNADKALYAAKAAGRNKVMAAEKRE